MTWCVRIQIPLRPLPSSAVPATSVPIQLAWTVTPYSGVGADLADLHSLGDSAAATTFSRTAVPGQSTPMRRPTEPDPIAAAPEASVPIEIALDETVRAALELDAVVRVPGDQVPVGGDPGRRR